MFGPQAKVRKNRLTDSVFFDQFPEFLDSCNSLPGQLFILGDFNIHYDRPHYPLTAHPEHVQLAADRRSVH